MEARKLQTASHYTKTRGILGYCLAAYLLGKHSIKATEILLANETFKFLPGSLCGNTTLTIIIIHKQFC